MKYHSMVEGNGLELEKETWMYIHRMVNIEKNKTHYEVSDSILFLQILLLQKIVMPILRKKSIHTMH